MIKLRPCRALAAVLTLASAPIAEVPFAAPAHAATQVRYTYVDLGAIGPPIYGRRLQPRARRQRRRPGGRLLHRARHAIRSRVPLAERRRDRPRPVLQQPVRAELGPGR